MKVYSIILFVLILVGVLLSVRLVTQDQQLDQTVFLQTTESIRNLQSLDKTFALQLNQSRVSREFDHTVLTDSYYELSEEFDNLRFDALFEEIEASPGLSQATTDFEEQFTEREALLDAYIADNSLVSTSLADVSALTKQLQAANLGEYASIINSFLVTANLAIYQLVTGENIEQPAWQDSASQSALEQIKRQLPEPIAATLTEYQTSTQTVFSKYAEVTRLFKTLEEQQTSVLLDAVEDEYTLYHNQAIEDSKQFRNSLIIYGLALLAALLLFAYQIRKNVLFLEQQVADRTAEISSAYAELQESQEQLIQSEKMASLGQMVAGVAHEINTPLGYVTSNVDTLSLNLEDLHLLIKELGEMLAILQATPPDSAELKRRLVKTLKTFQRVDADVVADESAQLLKDGAFGLVEISKLVNSLKDFARLDRQQTEKVNLEHCIDSSLTIARNHIRENNVEVIKKLAELPPIACMPSKLNQLFLNVITNACQAMSANGGQLLITAQAVNGNIEISFTDQGTGMDETTQQKMFDPFFTTKEIGRGTGLGMSIAYKIIEAHQGKITVDSTLDKGTKISITLPIDEQ